MPYCHPRGVRPSPLIPPPPPPSIFSPFAPRRHLQSVSVAVFETTSPGVQQGNCQFSRYGCPTWHDHGWPEGLVLPGEVQHLPAGRRSTSETCWPELHTRPPSGPTVKVAAARRVRWLLPGIAAQHASGARHGDAAEQRKRAPPYSLYCRTRREPLSFGHDGDALVETASAPAGSDPITVVG